MGFCEHKDEWWGQQRKKGEEVEMGAYPSKNLIRKREKMARRIRKPKSLGLGREVLFFRLFYNPGRNIQVTGRGSKRLELRQRRGDWPSRVDRKPGELDSGPACRVAWTDEQEEQLCLLSERKEDKQGAGDE